MHGESVRTACLSGLVSLVLAASVTSLATADQPANAKTHPSEESQSWMRPLPVPTDPELEEQISEVQEALTTIHKQIVRRKDTLETISDPAQKTVLYDEVERLRKVKRELEVILNQLVEEARASERTAIDEALAQARWFEHYQEKSEQREELIRDRQQ